jgi:hypothetical protein
MRAMDAMSGRNKGISHLSYLTVTQHVVLFFPMLMDVFADVRPSADGCVIHDPGNQPVSFTGIACFNFEIKNPG